MIRDPYAWVLMVSCPSCNAPVGYRCVTASGREVRKGESHAPRFYAASAAGYNPLSWGRDPSE